MTTDVEIDRVLAALTATLNDHRVETFDAAAVQEIGRGALGGDGITVDDGGGIHDASGRRIGTVRRTDSGEWIADRQNDTAERSRTAVPTQSP
ncbi:MAG: hypothetical protein ACJ780_11245 [Solirubrobacteraceae bacterium]